MSKYQEIETSLRGLYIVTSPFYPDSRGFFSEMYHKKEFVKMGFTKEFVQDNYSCSKRGVLRGLHFQKKTPTGKVTSSVERENFGCGIGFENGK